MSENNSSSKQEEKKKERVIPVSVFVGVALFVLIAATVFLYAFVQRKKVESDLDKRLTQRRDKIIALDTWYMNAMKAYSLTIDPDSEGDTVRYFDLNRMDKGYLLVGIKTVFPSAGNWNINLVQTDDESTETYRKDSYSFYTIDYQEYSDTDYSYVGELPAYSTLLVDPDEDSFFVKEDIPYICYGGLIYRDTFLYDSEHATLGFGREGLNVQSVENLDIRAAAFSILSKNASGDENESMENLKDVYGSEGTYRYCMFRSVVGVSLQAVEANDIDSTERSDFIPLDYGEEVPDFSYLYTSTVIFIDAGPALASWRNQVVAAGLTGLVIYAILLFGTILLEKRNRRIKIVMEAEAAQKDISIPVEKLHSDLAEELIAKIEAAENSMGPNGYLDEIKDTIEKMKK